MQTESHTIPSPTPRLTKVAELIAAKAIRSSRSRVAVRPGGCSGFSYEMFFDSDIADDDVTSAFGAVKVVVDPASASRCSKAPALTTRTGCRAPDSHQQPQRHPQLRLRQLLQLTDTGGASASACSV